jgi:hypothetical protein
MICFKYKNNFFVLVKDRYLALPRILRYFVCLSILVIVIVEFYLKQYPSEFFIQEALGIFALNLSYSNLAGFILYYIVVFDPLEKKKIASHRILANRITTINMIISGIVNSIYIASGSNTENKPQEELDLKAFKRSCILIHPMTRCVLKSGFSSKAEEYDNWYDALMTKGNEIRLNIDILMYYSDCIDTDLLSLISGLRDSIEMNLNFQFKNSLANQNLVLIGGGIFQLYQEANLIIEMFGKRHIKPYDSQYHLLYRNLYGKTMSGE